MCRPELRDCRACGWRRPWIWHKCRPYLLDEIAACRLGEHTDYHPSECPNTQSYQTSKSTWPFPYPALQCGNEACPELPNADAVRQEIKERLEREKREYEALMREIREKEERRRERFARKYFVKRPVLSIDEQQRLLDEQSMSSGS